MRQIGEQMDQRTGTWTNKRMRQANWWTSGQIGRWTDTEMRQTSEQLDQRTDRQVDRHTDETDKLTGGPADR